MNCSIHFLKFNDAIVRCLSYARISFCLPARNFIKHTYKSCMFGGLWPASFTVTRTRCRCLPWKERRSISAETNRTQSLCSEIHRHLLPAHTHPFILFICTITRGAFFYLCNSIVAVLLVLKKIFCLVSFSQKFFFFYLCFYNEVLSKQILRRLL